MDSQKMQEIQEKFKLMQLQIQEMVASNNGEVIVVFNGNMQITSLSINGNAAQLNALLIETINKGIKQVSEKIKNNMLLIQQQML
jgi:DNA-binding protein YbaB